VRRAIEEGGFPNMQVVVVDHGLERGEHYRMEWGDTPVEFIGRHHQSEVAALYARLDVLLAPSIWPESFGLVTREAIHAGVWVIASERGAIGDCVEEGVTGNVVSVDDHLPLMEAIRRVPEVLGGRGDGSGGRRLIGINLELHLSQLHLTYRNAFRDFRA
jgi:glycosyltransferase involved in cell wall biosynthesis